jgi:hypothetical protein
MLLDGSMQVFRRGGNNNLKHNVAPLEFDGRNDSVLQLYKSEKKRYMEYVELTGTFADIPVEAIVDM